DYRPREANRFDCTSTSATQTSAAATAEHGLVVGLIDSKQTETPVQPYPHSADHRRNGANLEQIKAPLPMNHLQIICKANLSVYCKHTCALGNCQLVNVNHLQ